jgi:hypothetical protein
LLLCHHGITLRLYVKLALSLLVQNFSTNCNPILAILQNYFEVLSVYRSRFGYIWHKVSFHSESMEERSIWQPLNPKLAIKIANWQWYSFPDLHKTYLIRSNW